MGYVTDDGSARDTIEFEVSCEVGASRYRVQILRLMLRGCSARSPGLQPGLSRPPSAPNTQAAGSADLAPAPAS